MGFKAYTVSNDSTGIIEMGEGKETIWNINSYRM